MAGFIMETLLALADAHVDFVVAGGVAMVLHGAERTTLDVDIALHMSHDNLRRALAVFDALGLVPRAPVPATDLLDAHKVRRMIDDKHAYVFTFVDPARPARQIDVFLRAEHSYDVLATDACIVTLEGRPVQVASRERLAAMKRSVHPRRPKDDFDLQELQCLNES